MTEALLPADRFVEEDFRASRVVTRASTILWRNLPVFVLVTTVANLPTYLSTQRLIGAYSSLVGYFLGFVLTTLSEAVVLRAAFEDMQGKRVNLGASIRIGLRRFFPIVGVAVTVSLLGFLGFIVLVVPGVILMTQCFVATPACVVEEFGVFSSMGRSQQLTYGNRWKIFALLLFLYGTDAIADNMIDEVLGSTASGIATLAAHVIWNGLWGAFSAIAAVVTYHDLRVAKEGVDTQEIASVFE